MAEPVGLHMSLDDLIKKQQEDQSGGHGKQPRAGGREGGRGGASRPGGRLNGRAGRSGGQASGGRHQSARTQFQQQRHVQQQRHGPQQQPQPHQQHQRQQYDDDYRQYQRCWQDESTGDVVFRFKSTDIVRIDTTGNITLRSGGYLTAVQLASLNDALNLIGIRVTCPSGDVRSGAWSISDGRTLTRFSEGVVLPAKGAQQAGRGRQLLLAFNSPNHAQQAAAAAASNAAAAAAQILPFMGLVPPGVPASRSLPVMPGAVNGAAGGGDRSSVFSRLGGKTQGQRFTPY